MAAGANPLLQHIRRFACGPTPAGDGELLARFARLRDEDAFAELVRRHGPMVRSVCRRVLGNTPAVEDSFQATFLVLARKAADLHHPNSLAAWLHSVARHLALKCQRAETRRRWHESAGAKVVPVVARPDPLDELTARELLLIVDEEIQRLPEVCRLPLILCGLEGLTPAEAARRLGWSLGSVKGRLVRGRKRLMARLQRRGLTLSAGLLLGMAAREMLTPALVAATVDTALRFTGGSAPVRALAQGALQSMRGVKFKLGLSLAILMGAMAAGAGMLLPSQPVAQQTKPNDAKTAEAINREGEPVPPGAQARIGTTRFRADRPIDDARFSADGKHLVACAGGNLCVWQASDGKLLRTIATKLAPPNVPPRLGDKGLAFAVHPRRSWIACGGISKGKTYLQIWDYETGEAIAQTPSICDALKTLAWTPDGKHLLERANIDKPPAWKLLVRDDQLAVVKSHDVPQGMDGWSTVMTPMPDSRQVLLWEDRREPTVFDLESGKVVRTIEYKPEIPSDLGISPDGKILAATSTNEICLFDFASGKKQRDLPVLRKGWEKPRPLFSPDGKTVYVWDHRPIAYDVASGKEKWRATFRTAHNVSMRLCDISPDGGTLLMRHGHALALVDAKTGTERNPASTPADPTGMVWSPDGKMLFTRTVRRDKTWTAWDARSGKRLYDLQPTGVIAGNDWKMLPDLFFIKGGKEIVVGIEKAESTEQSGAKELLVFDAASGKCLRRLGKPLPLEPFRWFHLIGVDDDGATVVMQNYTISAPGAEPRYETFRWDPVRQIKLQAWSVEGDRMDPPRTYVPYDILARNIIPEVGRTDVKVPPAVIRCYSLADGKVAHELKTDFDSAEVDRLQGNFLLSIGYNSRWVMYMNNSHTYAPQSPFTYDLWELPSRQKVLVFGVGKKHPIFLGPGAQYLVLPEDDNSFEIREQLVLTKIVTTIATPARPVHFAFSPDGKRVAVSLADTTIVVWDTTPWRKQVQEQLAREVPADLTPLWDDLAKDAPKGLRAARLLSAAGDKAVALLAAKMTVPKGPDGARIQQWIADLDSSDFTVREKAEKELRSLAGQAEPHLRNHLKANPPLEVKRRIGGLLRDIDARNLTAAEIRQVRAVQALQWMDTAAARALLARWAEGDPAVTLTQAAKKASRR